MTLLVTFGDSWPSGTELSSSEKTYGALIAEMLSTEFKNYARSATSNEHMILQLKKYIESPNFSNDTIAIFFVTSPARALSIDFNGKEKELYPGSEKNDAHSSAWYKFFHTPHQDKFRVNSAILSLQRMCEQYKIKDYYIIGWSDVVLDYPGIDKTKIYDRTCAELFGVSGENEFSNASKNQYVAPNICHPNQKGHVLIAETLMKWISNDQTLT